MEARPLPRVRVVRPVLGLQGALQVGEQAATAQQPLWHRGQSQASGDKPAAASPASPSEAKMPVARLW